MSSKNDSNVEKKVPVKYKFSKCINENSKINLLNFPIRALIDDTFDLFKSIKNEYLLIFSHCENYEKYSLIIYDMKSHQIRLKIGNAHEQRIYTCRHFLDKKGNRDLLITSSFDRYIKIWDLTNYYKLIYTKKPDYNYQTNTYLLSENLLFYNNKNYLITSCYEINSKGYNILYYDYEENTKNNKNEFGLIENSKDNTNYLGIYYDKDIPIIISGNLGNIKIFDFSKKELINTYKDNGININYLSVIIKENKNKNKIVIGSSADGPLRIWDYNNANLISKIFDDDYDDWLIGLCLINENYILAGCYDNKIREYDLETNSFVCKFEREENNDETDVIFCIKNIKIEGKKYLVSHSNEGFINLWEEQK